MPVPIELPVARYLAFNAVLQHFVTEADGARHGNMAVHGVEKRHSDLPRRRRHRGQPGRGRPGRSSRPAELATERRGYFGAVSLSPDGRRVALEVNPTGAGSDVDMRVWTLGLDDDTFFPLHNEGRSGAPLWSPDGSTVYFK